MPQEKKGRTQRVSKGAKDKKAPAVKIEEQAQCHVHNEVGYYEINEIRKNVCVNDEPLTEFEGNHYCLFHLPTDDKDVKKFIAIFQNRFAEIEKKVDEIEKLSKTAQELEKENIYYYFPFIWFPTKFSFSNYTFRVTPDFAHATFSKAVYFEETVFSDWAYFEATTFLDTVDFDKAQFSSSPHFENVNFKSKARFFNAVFKSGANFFLANFESAEFGKAVFDGKADFSYTKFDNSASFDTTVFNKKTYFSSAKFNGHTLFINTKFNADCDFSKAKFSKNSNTSFAYTSFFKEVHFVETRFRGNVKFTSASFGDSSNVFFRHTVFGKKVNFQYCTSEGYLRFSNLRQGKDCSFDFQEAAFEKALRISFHTVRLHPSWFVNIDSRKFILTNICWKNLERKRDNSNITTELEKIDANSISKKQHLLEIACRQLAVNAEENNRYEEAACFRYMAMETKRLAYKWQGRFWTISWWYRFSSGYGERWKQAALVLFSILVFFGMLYWSPLSTFDYGERQGQTIIVQNKPEKKDYETAEMPPLSSHSMDLGEGLVHSLFVAALQRPEPKAADTWTKLFVILETIFAPVQAALLALAIRRKFMR